MSEELFDVCDEQDRVIGQAPRSRVHAENLLHRAVHIWVWNSRGELLVHLRSIHKDQFPHCFTSSSSGHVDAGEDYDAAAHRELREELGLAGELKLVMKLPASPETAYEHTVLYFLHSDETPSPDPLEIESLHYFSPGELVDLLARAPEKYTPPFRELFRTWIANES